MDNLRSKLIRLAHAKPALRPHLLPLLKVAERHKGEVWQTPAGNWRAKNEAGHEKSFSGSDARQQAQSYSKGSEKGDKLPKSKEPMKKIHLSPEQKKKALDVAADTDHEIERTAEKLEEHLKSDEVKQHREKARYLDDKTVKYLKDISQEANRWLARNSNATMDAHVEQYDLDDPASKERSLKYKKVTNDLVDSIGFFVDDDKRLRTSWDWDHKSKGERPRPLSYDDIPFLQKAVGKFREKILKHVEDNYADQ